MFGISRTAGGELARLSKEEGDMRRPIFRKTALLGAGGQIGEGIKERQGCQRPTGCQRGSVDLRFPGFEVDGERGELRENARSSPSCPPTNQAEVSELGHDHVDQRIDGAPRRHLPEV